MKKTTSFIAIIAFVVMAISTSVIFLGDIAYAAPKDVVCQGADAAVQTGDCAAGGVSIDTTIRIVLNLLSWVAGIIAVFMVIVGGLKYVTSNGDTTKTASAKDAILYAIIGAAVVILAQTIIRFVVNKSPQLISLYN